MHLLREFCKFVTVMGVFEGWKGVGIIFAAGFIGNEIRHCQPFWVIEHNNLLTNDAAKD